MVLIFSKFMIILSRLLKLDKNNRLMKKEKNNKGKSISKKSKWQKVKETNIYF